jgi:hypothetical protein
METTKLMPPLWDKFEVKVKKASAFVFTPSKDSFNRKEQNRFSSAHGGNLR